MSPLRLLLACSAAALAAAAAAPSAQSPISIEARPRVVPAVGDLVLSGILANGQAHEHITVQANECLFPGWREVATAETEPGGVWHVTPPLDGKTTFRAKWKTAVSAGVTVQHRPRVDLEHLGRTRWTVRVLALRSFLDRHAQLQRFDRRTRRWRTVKSVRLTDKFSYPAGTYTGANFRARVPRGTQVRATIARSQVKPCYLAGYSLILTT